MLRLQRTIKNLPSRLKLLSAEPLQKILPTSHRCLVVRKQNEYLGIDSLDSESWILSVVSVKYYPLAYFSYFRAFLGSLFLIVWTSIFCYLFVTKSPIIMSNTRPTLIIMDQSLSMAVEDIWSPTPVIRSRLDLAKELVRTSIHDIKNLGIISYAKNPKLISPISPVSEWTMNLISSIEPESELWWSDLPLALKFAKNLYSHIWLTLIIYTDGGSTSESPLPELPKNWDVIIYGIGSKVWWKIPLGYNAQGERRYKYYSGSEIIVPYDEVNLSKIAKKIGAEFRQIDTYGTTPKDLYHPTLRGNTLSILSIILVLFGIIITPYVRKKHPLS